MSILIYSSAMLTLCLLRWEAVGAIATYVEAAALVGIFVWDRLDAKEQHKQTLEQLKAAKDAAAAALLNARAAIAAERSWIVVTPRRSTISEHFFDVTNKGRTPAKLESVAFSWTFDSYTDKSRVAPNHANKIYPERTFLEQNAGFVIPIKQNPMATIDAAKLGERVVKGNQFLIYDGKITYRDAFELEGAEQVIHETVWSYYYDHTNGNLVRINEFNRYT